MLASSYCTDLLSRLRQSLICLVPRLLLKTDTQTAKPLSSLQPEESLYSVPCIGSRHPSNCLARRVVPSCQPCVCSSSTNGESRVAVWTYAPLFVGILVNQNAGCSIHPLLLAGMKAFEDCSVLP